MNKIYNVVYSEEHGTWVVCSELDKRGRKKSSRTSTGKLLVSAAIMGASLASMPAQASTCGDGSTVASGGSCDMGVYSSTVNDRKVGQTVASGGDTVTVTTPDINNITSTSNDRPFRTGRLRDLFTDAGILSQLAGLERLNPNQKGETRTVRDPISGSNQTVNVYNNILGQPALDIEDVVTTGNDVYVDMRVGTATGNGSKIIASLGDATAAMVDNSVATNRTALFLSVKDSRLVQAENGASAEWTSKNRISFNQGVIASDRLRKTYTLFEPKTVTFMGNSYTLNTVQDLINYNDNVLKPAIGTPGFANSGETQQAAYDRWFNEAARRKKYTFDQANPIIPTPDSQLPVGEVWVMSATGNGSTATLKNGGQIDHRSVRYMGGGILAEEGGKAVIEQGAILSGVFNSLTVRGAGSTAENHGVISGGYYASDNFDTSKDSQANKNNNYIEATTVDALNGGAFTNKGIINVAGFTYPNLNFTNYGIRVNNATAVNQAGGVINVAVNKAPDNAVQGVRVENNGTFTADAGSEIFIGRTAQYSSGAPTTLIGNTSDQVGILVNGNNAVLNNNGTITIGKETQGATAVRVSSGNASTKVNLGVTSVINVSGNATMPAGSQPKQNIGIQAQNSDNAEITNAGTINVNGTNGVGENVVAEAGRTAKITNTATSKITVEEASANLVTRNYGIYADGQGTGKADVVADGTLTLKGDNVIGAHARGNSTMTVNAGMKAVFDNSTNAKNQIAYHINGGNAVANVVALANSTDITTENSTMFRADAGGTVNATDLTVTASGKDAVILASDGADAAGKASAVNVNNGTYNLTGSGSKVALVSGGATASLKGTANVADTATNATIGVADGKNHGLNNQAVAGSSPNNKTKLVSELNTTTNAAGVTGYTAQNSGTVDYSGNLDLKGANSVAVQTLNNGTANLNNAMVKANGDALRANAGNNTINVNGGTVTGTTNVFNSVAGTNSLVATNGAVLNGVMSLAAGTSSVELANGTTWNNTGNSTVTSLDNAGTVAFATPTTAAVGNYKTITVNGDYTGNNGKLVVNTLWNSDADKDSDHLIIKGAASGKTIVSTPNGIIGNITKTTAQQFSSDVVTVEQPAANAAGQQVGQPDGNAVFTGTADTTNAGQAQLVLKSTAGGKNVYAWTLYATPAPAPAPAPGHYIFAPGVSAYTLMPQVNQEIGYNTLSATLHERRGENQIMAWDECATCGDQAKGQTWARLLGRGLNSEGKERFNFETKMGGVQIGHDFAIRRNDKGGHNLTGVFAAYTHATTDFFDRYRAVGGVVVDDKFTGEGKTDAVSLGVSNTYYAQNGSYLDLVGQVSWLRNNYKARDSVSVKQNGWGAGLSAEVGRPFALGERAENEGGWMIEPQAQLMYQYVGLKNFNDGIRQVEQNGQHGLRGRLGARLAYNAPNSNLRTNTFYAVANVWNDFIKPRNIHIGADSVSEKRNTTWGELGLGAQLPLSKNAYLYGDARYERNLGGAKRDGYRGTVGFKYTWK